MSIAALVCGILGIVCTFLPYVSYIAIVLAILGIVFGAKAIKLAKENQEPTGLAVAGLVLGIIGTVISALSVPVSSALWAWSALPSVLCDPIDTLRRHRELNCSPSSGQ